MSRLLAITAACTVILGMSAVAQGGLLFDFEAPAYTAGVTLDGQDGWTATAPSSVQVESTNALAGAVGAVNRFGSG